VFQPVTGLEAATCLMTSPAFCQPLPKALAKAMDQAQGWITSAGATSHHGRAKQLMERASRTLKRAAKKATKLSRKGSLSPACAAALNRNLLEASSRLTQLRKSL